MKTIEEAAKEYAEKNKKARKSDFITKKDFKAGVEFAQRWIHVEEELPEKFDKNRIINEVLIKSAEEYINLGWYEENHKCFYSFSSEYKLDNVTHWRPIEYK